MEAYLRHGRYIVLVLCGQGYVVFTPLVALGIEFRLCPFFVFLLPPPVFSVRIRVLYTCLELEAREVSAASGRDHRRISTAFSKNSQSIIMADHLAQIFGTEKDRVNCPFYFKIGTMAGLGRVVCRVSCVVCCPAPGCSRCTNHSLHAARCTTRSQAHVATATVVLVCTTNRQSRRRFCCRTFT